MRDHIKLRDTENSALSGSLKDTSAFSLQPEHLCLLMEQKASLVSGYFSISEAMYEELLQGKDAGIDCFISKRQNCMNNIKKTDRSIEKWMKTKRDGLKGIPGDFKDAFAGYLAHIKTLLEKTAAIDAEVIGMVKEKCRNIKAELLTINNAGQAAKGYRMKSKYIPMYLDEKK